MNFKFADKINPYLEKFDFAKALDIAESNLKKTADSEFHAVLGQSLVHQTEEVAEWVDHFFTICSARLSVKALYFEINDFTINTDEWNIDGLMRSVHLKAKEKGFGWSKISIYFTLHDYTFVVRSTID